MISETTGFSVKVKDNLMLRVYSDCQPHNLEISSLQKGLVLVRQGKDLIGEGTGFGLPIIKYSEKTYLSTEATVLASNISEKESEESFMRVTKRFMMDTVSRKTLGDKVFVDGSVYNRVSRLIQRKYRENPSSRWITKPLVELRNPLFGIRTLFCRVQPKGYVTMVYDIFSDRVVVRADFTKVSKQNCERFYLMNEQSSTFFRIYLDSDGKALKNEEIGAWDRVEAHYATLSNIYDGVFFTLERLPNCELFRGRERIRGRFDWAGLDYELNPTVDSFEYTICLDKSHEH